MRKIITITQVTLDGVMQAPGGHEEDPSNGFTHGGWAMLFGDDALKRAVDEMQGHFVSNPIEAADELRFMPEPPFRYYMLGFRDCIVEGKFDSGDVSDAASCFLGPVLQKLEQQPRYIIPNYD